MSLTINLNDTGGAAPGTQARAGFQAAADLWKQLLGDTVTLNISVGFTHFADPGILGQTSYTPEVVSYSAFKANLAADAKTANDATAVANLPSGSSLNFWTYDANGNLIWDNNGTTNNTRLYITSGEAKALGLAVDANGSPINPTSDASITFSSDFNWDFNPDDGIGAGQQDFVDVAFHEIGHALGFVSGVDTVDGNTGSGPGGQWNLDPYAIFSGLDVFRYGSAGTLDLAPGGSPYFSINGGRTSLGQFSTGTFQGDGWQASHWKEGMGLGIMDPTAQPAGSLNYVTDLDLTAFDVIGWDVTATHIQQGDQYANTLSGTSAADFLQGRGGNDSLFGYGGNDTLDGGSGTNTIDGGAGRDTAVFGFSSSQATITHNADNSWTISYGGTSSTLTNVEIARFSDRDVSLRLAPTNDFDSSNVSDFAWRNTTTGQVALWEMNSSGQIQQSVSVANLTSGWVSAGVGDFNGDGTCDFAWRNSTTGQVALWEMNSGHIQQSVAVANLTSGWVSADVGDFNGDGTCDFAWRNSSTGQIALWEMNSGHIQQSVAVANLTSGWVSADVGDFNGDGTCDFAWRNSSTGQIALWEMNSGHIQQSVAVASLTSGWVSADVGDFNGDGTCDFAWRNSSTGQIALWEMNSSGHIQQSVGVANLTSGWVSAGVGDFNGDGISDFAWRNSSTGQVAIWEMNSSGHIQQSIGVANSTSAWVTV